MALRISDDQDSLERPAILFPFQPLNWGINMQAGQVVNELGVRIVDVVQFNVSHSDEYRRCDNRVLEKILII